jgi:hypothetical protein
VRAAALVLVLLSSGCDASQLASLAPAVSLRVELVHRSLTAGDERGGARSTDGWEGQGGASLDVPLELPARPPLDEPDPPSPTETSAPCAIDALCAWEGAERAAALARNDPTETSP